MKSLFKNRIVMAVIFLAIGLAAGWFLFHTSSELKEDHSHEETAKAEKEQVWTCAMHPQIRQNEPGNCPICGMELIPVSDLGDSETVFQMSPSALKLANVQTTAVDFTLPVKEIFLQGKVKVDERRVKNQIAHITGRVEQLYVSFTGEKVERGQKLASIYSPELVTAQKELLEAAKSKGSNDMLYNAARNKLKQWKFNDQQIDEIENSGKVKENIDVLADISGVVMQKKVSVGDYVKQGAVLFIVADLSRVWVEFDAYEADLPWLQEGNKISFSLSALPGKTFEKKITFIDPVISPATRTASLRLEMDNRNGVLKPEMFASGTVKAKLPIDEAQLTVPKSAVMWTGKRSVVYVKVPDMEQPTFEFREVTLGHDLGAYYIIEEGLRKGEEVVSYGTFKVDAAAQLAGKKSMMNRSKGSGQSKQNQMDKQSMKGMSEVSFKVFGNCVMCQERIEEAAYSVAGIKHASWNKDTKIFTMHYDSSRTSKGKVSKAISKVGHDTEMHEAADSSYTDLPSCCQYTR